VRFSFDGKAAASSLEAADEWSDEFRACLGASRGKVPRPKQKPIRDLRDVFA